MKVTGFTFIRNALIYDYPVVEAIRSILPICDDFVVAVGNSDDATLELISQIDPEKIRIIETTWDDSLARRRTGTCHWKQIKHTKQFPMILIGLFIFRVMKWFMKNTWNLLKMPC